MIILLIGSFGIAGLLVGVLFWSIPRFPQQYRTKVYGRIPIAQDLLTTESEVAKSGPGVNITITERNVCRAFHSYIEDNEPKPIPGIPRELTVEGGQVYAEFPDGSGQIFLQMGNARSIITDILKTRVAVRYRNYAKLIVLNSVSLLAIAVMFHLA